MVKLISLNPYTEKINAEFETLTQDKIEQAVMAAKKSFGRWKNVSPKERTLLIKNLGQTLRKNKRTYAETITKEMGKVIKESLAEIEKCAWLSDYYSENTEKFLEPEIVATEAKKSYVCFQPLGTILAIMPWNFPFWQVFRCAVPAIAAGNALLLKHAPGVPLCALTIEEIFQKAGFPKNLFQTLLIDEQSAMNLMEEDKVDGVSLTGSCRAGEQIGALAGKRIKPQVLELGGSDAFIVLDDADVEKAAEFAVKSRFINAGQSCIAAKRFIVQEKVGQGFIEKFSANLNKLKIGDPMKEGNDMGPLAQRRFVDALKIQLGESEKLGGKIIEGPEIKEKTGFFFRPVILANATKDMKVMQEEVFGPVAPVIFVKTEEEAIAVTNDTSFGLAASVWTKDLGRGERLTKEIEAGFVAINDMVKSDPRLPFGGIKKSGVGRELSHYGLKEFANVKTIVVN